VLAICLHLVTYVVYEVSGVQVVVGRAEQQASRTQRKEGVARSTPTLAAAAMLRQSLFHAMRILTQIASIAVNWLRACWSVHIDILGKLTQYFACSGGLTKIQTHACSD
jgi:hypothetical protein